MKMSFHSHAGKTHFHMKGFARGPALKKRYKTIRKWPIISVLEVSGDILGAILVSKLCDAGPTLVYFSKISFEKCFMVDRIKQPKGCIGISEKCVFVLKGRSFTSTLFELNKFPNECYNKSCR